MSFCLAKAWRDEAHLAWGCERRVDCAICGSAASAFDHLWLGPWRGLRRREKRLELGVAGAGGAGSGCQLFTPYRPGTHFSTWAPEYVYARVQVHIHTGLAHACTYRLLRSSHSHTFPIRSYQLIHMPTWKWKRAEAGRVEQSWGKSSSHQPLNPGKEKKTVLPQATWQKLTQLSSLLMPRPCQALWLGHRSTVHRHNQENCCHVWGECLLCARHSAKSLGALAHSLLLTPTCEKGSC
jgi:hypothetical protein